jgi:hypothetical protein
MAIHTNINRGDVCLLPFLGAAMAIQATDLVLTGMYFM